MMLWLVWPLQWAPRGPGPMWWPLGGLGGIECPLFKFKMMGCPMALYPIKWAQWPHYCSGQGRRPAPGKNLGPAVGRAEGPHLENFGPCGSGAGPKVRTGGGVGPLQGQGPKASTPSTTAKPGRIAHPESGKDLTPWPQLANPWSKKPLGHRHTHVCEFAKGPLILADCWGY